MDKIAKLFKKISSADRRRLLKIIEVLLAGKRKGLNIVKIKRTDFYRLRSGKFRIIFHYANKTIVIDSIKMRNEGTYKRM